MKFAQDRGNSQLWSQVKSERPLPALSRSPMDFRIRPLKARCLFFESTSRFRSLLEQDVFRKRAATFGHHALVPEADESLRLPSKPFHKHCAKGRIQPPSRQNDFTHDSFSAP